MAFKPQISPNQDTGWGLIFRLNDLLREVENFAVHGEYDEWNYKLDRIWANLTYRENLDIKEVNGKIVSIDLSEKDMRIKRFIDNQISKYKRGMNFAKKEAGENWKKDKDYKLNKNGLYKTTLLKDIWIRKLMHKINNLYIKEIKHNPAGSMFGR